MHRLAMVLAILAVGALAAISGGRPEQAQAADCNGPCMRLDAIPGGAIDASASVSGTFGVDVVLQNTGGQVAGFQFYVRFNPGIVRASAPVPLGVAASTGSWNCELLPRTADYDGNPGTGDAFMGCFSYGTSVDEMAEKLGKIL